MYMAVRNSPIPKNVAKDSESNHKDGKEIQLALDAHVVADNMVEEAK